jgi:hypothetical protein
MQNEENDKDPNSVSNQDMREYKSADQGVRDSGGLSDAESESGETESAASSWENRSGDSGGSAVEDDG